MVRAYVTGTAAIQTAGAKEIELRGNPLLTNDARLPATVIAAQADLGTPAPAVELDIQNELDTYGAAKEATAAAGAVSAAAAKASADLANRIAPDNASIVAAKTAAQAANAKLTSSTVTITSPVAADGSFSIIQGDDVSLPWTRAWTDSEPTAAELRLMLYTAYRSGSATTLLTKACTIALVDGTLAITAALTAAETEALPTDPPAGNHAIMAQVVLTVAGETQTLALGRGEVRRKVG